MQQIAGFTVPEARLLVISPYDKGALGAIEKAMQNSRLGLSPSNDGQVIRLNFPPLTEERRKELVRVVRGMAEEGRISVRHARRGARHDLEGFEHDGDISADDLEPGREGARQAHPEVRGRHRRRARAQGAGAPRGVTGSGAFATTWPGQAVRMEGRHRCRRHAPRPPETTCHEIDGGYDGRKTT